MKKHLACILITCLLLSCAACSRTVEAPLSGEDSDSTTTVSNGETQTTHTDGTRKTQADIHASVDLDETDETDGEQQSGGSQWVKKTRGTTTKKTREIVTSATFATTTKKTTAKTTEDPAVYPSNSHTVKELVSAGKLLTVGRAVLVGEELQIDPVNAGFEVTGKLGGKLTVETVSDRVDSILNVVVDDGDPIIVHVPKGTNTVTLIEYLSKGKHTVKIISGTSMRFGTVSIKKFSYDGELSKISRDTSRLQIEVIGDSISCGWGQELARGGSFTQAQLVAGSNSYYSYAGVASRILDADLSVMALCAQTIPAVHKNLFPYANRRSGKVAWDFTNNQQDVVVIALGTNDEYQGLGAAATLTNAKSLMTDVRAKYPNAYIIYMYGMMRNTYAAQYEQAVSDMNDSKILCLDVSAYANTQAYEGHPNLSAQETLGMCLADFIQRNCE